MRSELKAHILTRGKFRGQLGAGLGAVEFVIKITTPLSSDSSFLANNFTSPQKPRETP